MSIYGYCRISTPQQNIERHAKEFGGSLSDPEVIKLAGISRNSYYKYKRELTEGEG